MTEIENLALYITEECRKAGMTLAGAAGVLANVEAESIFNPRNVQDSYEHSVGNDDTYTTRVDNGSYLGFTTDAAGYGLAQWTAGDRKALLLARAKKLGVSIGDFKMQVGLLIDEMRGYTKAWGVVTQSNNPYECGYAVCKYYEIPANTEAQAQYRGSQAQNKWYPWIASTFSDGITNSIESSIESTTESAVSTINPVEDHAWEPSLLRYSNSYSSDCVVLQALLNAHHFACGSADGFFGAKTQAAVNKAQQFYGLAVDGICGKETWSKLLEAG